MEVQEECIGMHKEFVFHTETHMPITPAMALKMKNRVPKELLPAPP